MPVADSVFAYLLAFARQTPWMDRQMKTGAWEKFPGRSLAECTLGIIGLGDIGTAVTKRALAFGMTVLGTDPNAAAYARALDLGVKVVKQDELLGRSDFVTLHCDLNPTSQHLMGDAQFARMKNTAVLVNTSRGPVVDEAALCRALAAGTSRCRGRRRCWRWTTCCSPRTTATAARRRGNACIAARSRTCWRACGK